MAGSHLMPGLVSQGEKSLSERNLEGYIPAGIDCLHMVQACKAVINALEEQWGPQSIATKRTRQLLNQLVGREEEKASLWSDRGGSLRDWRMLFALLPVALTQGEIFKGLPLQEDTVALEIITLLTEIFAITYSSDQVDFEERCCRCISLMTRGYLLGRLCVQQ